MVPKYSAVCFRSTWIQSVEHLVTISSKHTLTPVAIMAAMTRCQVACESQSTLPLVIVLDALWWIVLRSVVNLGLKVVKCRSL